MATTVILVRHGKTPTTGSILPGRAPGLHLAESGLAQAEAAATRVAQWGEVAAVYASPMERTRETAAPIARACGVRVRTARGLIECDFGDWTGRRLSELRRLKAWKSVQRSPSTFRFPGGESFTEMQVRITEQIAALVERHPKQTIVAVSHADPIKAAVAHAAGAHIDLFQRYLISPCSVSAVSYGEMGPFVLTINSTGSAGDLGG
jgi:probable phosphomutase (TIGR03848 family)